MSPTAGMMLVTQIQPLIAAAVARGAVKAVGCEDVEELTAEGVALAAKALESAEKRGKEVPPQSVAYYAIEGLKQGRRSGYAGKSDVMSSAASLCGRASLRSLDEPLMAGDDDPDQEVTLHDALAAPGEDPDHAAGWRVDLGALVGRLDARQKDVLVGTARGDGLKDIADRNRISPPRAVQLKRQIADKALMLFGTDIVADAGRTTMWRAGLRAGAERRACRHILHVLM